MVEVRGPVHSSGFLPSFSEQTSFYYRLWCANLRRNKLLIPLMLLVMMFKWRNRNPYWGKHHPIVLIYPLKNTVLYYKTYPTSIKYLSLSVTVEYTSNETAIGRSRRIHSISVPAILSSSPTWDTKGVGEGVCYVLIILFLKYEMV